MKFGDWESMLKTAQKGMAMEFLVHLCEKYEIKSEGTVWQNLLQWKQCKSMGVYLNWC
jgi:hypothetical protein